jgi:2-polyprenyl-6-hydroxyphenyl methylase/3-demethylubiquinone-9 3-methyltransferase
VKKKGWSTQDMKKSGASDAAAYEAKTTAEGTAGLAGMHKSLEGGTVDKAEVDKFSAIGASWWDLQGMQKPLHSFNALRVPFLQSMMAQHINAGRRAGAPKIAPHEALRSLRVVDVGCGGGILAEALAQLGADVLAIDASGENIQVAEQHARAMGLLDECGEEDRRSASREAMGGRLRYRHMTAEDLHKEGQMFDVVVCSEVLPLP